MTRHRRSRTWPWSKRTAAKPEDDPVTEPIATTTESVEIVADVSEFARAVRMLDAGVAATRARVENRRAQDIERKRREAEAHRRQHGPYLSPAAVVPAPPMPGGAG